jgi:hypothetical protein
MTETNKIVFILGAGFSKNFGLPLLDKIFPMGIEKLKNKYPNSEEKFCFDWNKLISNKSYKKMNYEEMLSRIDLELNYLNDIEENKEQKYALWHLRDSLIQIFWEAVKKDLTEKDNGILEKFFKICNQYSTIISFNQDIILEKYFEENKIF